MGCVAARDAGLDEVEAAELLPQGAAEQDATWRSHDRFRTGAYGELEGNEYAIRLPEIVDSAACTGASTAECFDHLAYTNGLVGGFVGVRIAGELWADVRGGVGVFRRFELLNDANEPVSFGEQRLPASPFVNVRLTYEY